MLKVSGPSGGSPPSDLTVRAVALRASGATDHGPAPGTQAIRMSRGDLLLALKGRCFRAGARGYQAGGGWHPRGLIRAIRDASTAPGQFDWLASQVGNRTQAAQRP